MSDWVFLRGLTRESRHWGDFPALFAATVRGARVTPIDLPGNGRRCDRRSPTTVAAMAAWCRTEVRRRGIPLPCRVFAMSLGAMVAIEWAAGHPDEVAGAVLVNTSLRPLNPLHHRLRLNKLPALFRTALLGRPGREREALVLRLTSAAGGDAGALLDRWTEISTSHPVSRGNALRQLLAAARYRAPPAAPAVPLLVLAGGRDALVDPECSRRLATAWGASFAEHPMAGHDLPLDDARWVAGQVRSWLGTQGGATRNP